MRASYAAVRDLSLSQQSVSAEVALVSERVTLIVLLSTLFRTSLDLLWVQLVILVARGIGGVSAIQVVSNDPLAHGCPPGVHPCPTEAPPARAGSERRVKSTSDSLRLEGSPQGKNAASLIVPLHLRQPLTYRVAGTRSGSVLG